MLIVGAGGFAREVLEIFKQCDLTKNLVFYDDITPVGNGLIYSTFPILRNEREAKEYFRNKDDRFTIGIGNPALRKKMFDKFSKMGGRLSSSISPRSMIGSFGVHIGEGANILDGVCISNSVWIGKGCIVYYNSIITHDCRIGEFVEISPGAKVLGRVQIGDHSQIGAGAIILPDRKIGNNVIIGAGAVVLNDLPNGCTAAGVPAKVIRKD